MADDSASYTLQGEAGQGARYAAVDIMNGPNAGLRLWLGKPRTVFGNHQDRSVIIERHPGGFRVAATHRGNTVTVNGTLLLSTPENLRDGDRIEFANMGLRFIETAVRPAHPDELEEEAGAEAAAVAPAASTPDDRADATSD